MAPKKKTRNRKLVKELSNKTPVKANGHALNGHANGHTNGHLSGNAMPLRAQTAAALETYFTNLNGHKPGHLYDLVLREVEEPLFRAVLGYVDGNQSRAAEVLGINRGTLRKKLREYGLTE